MPKPKLPKFVPFGLIIAGEENKAVCCSESTCRGEPGVYVSGLGLLVSSKLLPFPCKPCLSLKIMGQVSSVTLTNCLQPEPDF